MFKLFRLNKTEYLVETTKKFDREFEDGDPLELSIQKWEFIVDGYKELGSSVTIGDGSCDTCALCKAYYSCEDGCPVFLHTNIDGCEETPYKDHLANPCLETAQAQVNFLKSLRS